MVEETTARQENKEQEGEEHMNDDEKKELLKHRLSLLRLQQWMANKLRESSECLEKPIGQARAQQHLAFWETYKFLRDNNILIMQVCAVCGVEFDACRTEYPGPRSTTIFPKAAGGFVCDCCYVRACDDQEAKRKALK